MMSSFPLPLLKRRSLIAAASLLAAPVLALAQTPIKFQLDWRFEGPAALFLASQAKGYYKAAGLDVTLGKGHVVLLGFRPQWRGQPFGTFKTFFNAVLTSTAPR